MCVCICECACVCVCVLGLGWGEVWVIVGGKNFIGFDWKDLLVVD